jgi:hypothetical protein
MIAAARATGARQKELAGASHLHLDRKAKRLTVVGKRNKLRVIDLDPFGGAAIFDSLSEGIANAPLFWHGNGRALRQCIEPVRPLHQPTCGKGTLISFGSGSITCGTFMRLNGYDRVARSTYRSTALGTTASRRLRSS